MYDYADEEDDDEEEEEEDLLIDQEFPPDGLEDLASDDEHPGGAAAASESALVDKLVRIHKHSIKQAEAMLKREKELLVSYATAQDGDDAESLEAYVSSLAQLQEEKTAQWGEMRGVLDQMDKARK